MKYIIEFEDEYSMNEGGMKYHQCKQVPYWSVSHGIIKNLTPYTEPDRKAIEDEVWEFLNFFTGMSPQERYECFDKVFSHMIVSTMSYREAKAKYEAWLKQKDEIHVGDEVTHTKGYKGIVTYINCELCDVLWDDGCVTEDVYKKEFFKTGRHFDEVADLLEKMRGEEE